jgi:hypothetical protein
MEGLPVIGERYLLARPLLAVRLQDGTRGDFTTVPINAVLTVEAVHSSPHMLVAMWDGKKILVFSEDLRDRGKLFSVSSAA